MLALLCAVLLAQDSAPPPSPGIYLKDPATGEETTLVMGKAERLDRPKLSPRAFPPSNERWEFDWLTTGYARLPGAAAHELRLRVYAQRRKPDPGKDEAFLASRMAMRLWALGNRRWKVDHPITHRGLRLVDLYLCWGGEAGGEQRFEEDLEAGQRRRVNAIYIYDLDSFDRPIEMAREIAHEYGHAVLPSVGGFGTPEDWANGYLGEKLYLRWLRDAIADGRLTPEDAMGATLSELDAWVRRNVDPQAGKVAAEGPNLKALAGKGRRAMDAFLGIVLHADAVLPPSAVAAALKSTSRPGDLPAALAEAAQESGYTVRATGKPVWLPLGSSSVRGGKALARSGGWAKVQPTAARVEVKPRAADL